MTVAIRFRGALAALSPEERRALLERGGGSAAATVAGEVREILARVRGDGDRALVELTRRFDGVALDVIEVPAARSRAALDRLPAEVRRALERAARNLATAHRAWLPRGARVETEPGVVLERRPFPLARVGIYAPGGRAAYPSSVLMGAVPAREAGVGEVILCSPPGADGAPSDPVLAAAMIGGVDRVFAVGGAQAIAALAFGTESVPRVDRIVGPGSVWVTEAKRQVSDRVGIDAPAGPSEVLVVADETTPPALVAAEVLAQAEHDPAAAAVAVVIGGPAAAAAIERALGDALAAAPRREIAARALAERGGVLRVEALPEAAAFAEEWGAEHLLLAFAGAEEQAGRFRVAGAVFAGRASSVAFGDYLTGANHVLPTGAAARSWSGLGPEAFVRWTTYQTVTAEAAARLAADTAVLADAEGLPAHAAAARRWERR